MESKGIVNGQACCMVARHMGTFPATKSLDDLVRQLLLCVMNREDYVCLLTAVFGVKQVQFRGSNSVIEFMSSKQGVAG